MLNLDEIRRAGARRCRCPELAEALRILKEAASRGCALLPHQEALVRRCCGQSTTDRLRRGQARGAIEELEAAVREADSG